MKPTRYWSWSLRNLAGRGRYVMRGKYTEEEAASMFKGQVPEKVEGSEEVRNLPETPEEVLENQTSTALTRWHLQHAELKRQAVSPAVPPPGP